MFVQVRVNQNVNIGDVVSYNSESSQFEQTTNSSQIVGVVSESAFLSEDNFYYANVIFAGICFAKASRDIADEGGKIGVESGGIYVDNNSDNLGIVSPLPKGGATRVQNDLVMVFLR